MFWRTLVNGDGPVENPLQPIYRGFYHAHGWASAELLVASTKHLVGATKQMTGDGSLEVLWGVHA
ncbi:hypothetical protein AU186_00665 [Mycobacterium sp. GA-1999]|nr:hypothetical protein AU185_01805 [Mycobacterium sp. GA-0227b]KUH87190.1 hypothetical protein AU186_00665 [Mycobacterium sp. GA-1999]